MLPLPSSPKRGPHPESQACNRSQRQSTTSCTGDIAARECTELLLLIEKLLDTECNAASNMTIAATIVTSQTTTIDTFLEPENSEPDTIGE